ncbi:MAG: type II toxin-antitoxin system RelE/ParE family toxin [Elusimicrobia bacterium]|nr:type II toxin-antitoxin system RelE/ParE family toxin [Elusimicrobiota bacterium]
MKKRPVVYLRRAQLDLAEIRRYIAKDHPDQASLWIDKLDHALSRLREFPGSGLIPRDGRLAARGYRVVVVGEYLAFYLVRSGRVEIRRVLHGKRRYSFLLR